jgi:hypothetical protein
MQRKELVVLIVTTIFILGNFYLWSLKQHPMVLFLETLPLGVLFMLWFLWFITRARTH